MKTNKFASRATAPLSPVPAQQGGELCALPVCRVWALTVAVAALLVTGCSNFDSRQQYWNQQLAGKLKAATMQQLKSFAANNQHEIHCNGDGISREGAADLSECYLVDTESKGALFNYRGKLFVMMTMTDGRVQ